MIEVSSAYLEVPGAALLSQLTATQTIPAWEQSASIIGPATVEMYVSSAYLEMPDTGLPIIGLTASQNVPAWTQVASLFSPVGVISGGGTISSEYAHRSLTATQTVPPWGQSAVIGEEGTLGPIELAAAQFIPAWAQIGRSDVLSNLTATQAVPDWTQVGAVYRDMDLTATQTVPAWVQRGEIGQATLASLGLSAAQVVPDWVQTIVIAPDNEARANQLVPPWTHSAFIRVGEDVAPSVDSQVWKVRRVNRTWKVTT